MKNRLNQSVLQFLLFFVFLSQWSIGAEAQQGSGNITGVVKNLNTLKGVPDVSIRLNPGGYGVVSDSSGRFELKNINPGTYNLVLSGVGFLEKVLSNVLVTSGNVLNLEVELEPAPEQLAEVAVVGRRSNVKAASLETPLSVQKLTSEEIKRNPGGNFDISKVVQSLPGVGGGVGGGGFRNDIIIRGGAPNENVFYLDGIEVPVINHFGTQGSGGGPQGILNANFIEEVKLSTSAFDARYDNALSSVLQFKQKTGNPNRTQGNVLLSATELALTLDGPISPKTTYLASVRRSYLQLLFQAIDLPIRPNYWDFQLKVNSKINDKTSINFIGIGAIDEFRFAAPKEATPEKLYAINSNPIINQWNYTVGISVNRLLRDGFTNLAISRNTLNNRTDKYEDNENPSEDTRTQKTNSTETENKLRWDITLNKKGWKWSGGIMAQYVDFNNEFFNVIAAEQRDNNGNITQPATIIQTFAQTDFFKYGAFFQVSKRLFNNRLGLSAGTRVDGNSLSTSESNPFKQFSPRASLSYALTNTVNLNASAGMYYKLPSYTQLAFQSNQGGNTVVNPGNYIQSNHLVAGTEWIPSNSFRLTAELFYKKYNRYPISVIEGISLANKGSEFGSIGNEPIVQNGEGRAYGLEIFAQKKLTKRFFGVLSYTLYKSEFTSINGRFIPASWDNRHLLSLTWGYKFPRNWELGIKFRFQGEAPFTPFDLESSRANFLVRGTGVLDFTLYNTQRLPAFNASDVRIDKKWFFKQWTLDVFLDVTNWYFAKAAGFPQYTFARTPDNSGFQTTDGQPIQANGSNAIPVILPNRDALGTPTFGILVEF